MTKRQDFAIEGELIDSLTDVECRNLLASRTFGRVGVTSGGLPVILPVRYFYDGTAITFRTGSGTKLRAAQNGDVLAFQVDAYDPDTCEGWSVLVLGRASVLTTEHEHDGLPSLDHRDGSDESLSHYVRLGCELITGRILAGVSAE